jgi:hypothetical protein
MAAMFEPDPVSPGAQWLALDRINRGTRLTAAIASRILCRFAVQR